ncbi:fluoride efflux transporter CrcB [Streptomyces europaeiscabiei]|uniref:fluoride efflux transporter CrcB n=1 Tax=Streptomyces europaeiscabiei TaxID=146819 RepID=UPI0029B2F40A|nr:fluoride efflux transporter CrcB [Streptomyces europaeiscabiei]MDX3589305.1 fluoride efflux transporter CrcB [Streptomyces europaeiscabiei]WUD30641.1 fluoride efflux transporter CrcB [Streptomyces europaeiscabiei]
MPAPHPDGPEASPSPDAPVADPPRPALGHGQAPVVAVVAVGGGIGATARYGASLLWPTGPAGFPWTTFWVNVVGCLVIGLFMIAITERWAAHRLVRPFFGTGVLGGFTTFSTYAVDIRRLLEEGHPGTALAYLAATLLAALTAVWLAAATARLALRTGLPHTGPTETREKGKRPS